MLCADNEEEAEALALTRDIWRLGLEKGNPGPIPSIAEAREYRLSAQERALIAQRRQHAICGTAAKVGAQLREIAQRHQADELVVISNCHDFAQRKNSYALLAKEFNLQGSV